MHGDRNHTNRKDRLNALEKLLHKALADQNMLVNWVKSIPTPPGEITLVHGEPKARKALYRALGL